MLQAIENPVNWEAMKAYWDAMNPHNPVESSDDSD
jgi:hypothetical protein